ncbi:MAG TPA: hypothetical protein VMJ66_10575 [Geobacteraceae bacterium]|nr:hypothetical protein [Geobacteraceae bacterium]
MLKRFSLILVCLLLFSFVVEAFHHHDDGEDHPDCAVCMAVVHHKADTSFTFSPLEIQMELTGVIPVIAYVASISKNSFTPANNRAPPA